MQLNISSPPHIRDSVDAKSIMRWVAAALLFPSAAAVYFFGVPALVLIVFTTLISVAFEAIFQWLAKKPITVFDGSAAVTGILIALILPSTLPLWMAGIGALFAIVIVKGLFG